jgi:hypothetical protein
MPERGITPKETIEGPPARACPILLRQTSFKALQEAIAFPGADGAVQGVHTARFGEIEQRGCALTPTGRALYDAALASKDFSALPDDWTALRRNGLAWFRYRATPQGLAGLAYNPAARAPAALKAAAGAAMARMNAPADAPLAAAAGGDEGNVLTVWVDDGPSAGALALPAALNTLVLAGGAPGVPRERVAQADLFKGGLVLDGVSAELLAPAFAAYARECAGLDAAATRHGAAAGAARARRELAAWRAAPSHGRCGVSGRRRFEIRQLRAHTQ